MTSTAPESSTSREFVKQSSLYQEFLAEREEILKHKWLESERLGYDIGFERALLDWIIGFGSIVKAGGPRAGSSNRSQAVQAVLSRRRRSRKKRAIPAAIPDSEGNGADPAIRTAAAVRLRA
jgi:hypothetical protein